MNILKTLVFQLWFLYDRNVKLKFGKNRIPLWLYKIFGRAKYTVSGIDMALSPYEFFWRQHMAGKVENSNVLALIDKYLPSNGIILDIGMNVGFFSLWAEIHRHAIVYAFEPSQRELKVFEINRKLNDAQNIEVFPFALGLEGSSKGLFLAPDHHPGMNSFLNHISDLNNGRIEKVEVKRLEKVLSREILEKVDVCKIDVEGFEVDVLVGIGESLRTMKNCKFIVEISPHFLSTRNQRAKDIYSIFQDNGFIGLFGLQEDRQYDEVFIHDNHT